MMSPYEGERIFEAEMVRLHQCDRSLYSCVAEQGGRPAGGFSLLQWLADRLPLGLAPATSPAPARAPQVQNGR